MSVVIREIILDDDSRHYTQTVAVFCDVIKLLEVLALEMFLFFSTFFILSVLLLSLPLRQYPEISQPPHVFAHGTYHFISIACVTIAG